MDEITLTDILTKFASIPSDPTSDPIPSDLTLLFGLSCLF